MGRGESMMLYIYPFLNAITVEYRKYHDVEGKPNSRAWGLRNWVWKTLAPGVGTFSTMLIPIKPIRYLLINVFNRIIQLALKLVVRSDNTIALSEAGHAVRGATGGNRGRSGAASDNAIELWTAGHSV